MHQSYKIPDKGFLIGQHNAENVAAAFAVASAGGINALEVINSFCKQLSIKTLYKDVGRDSADPDKVWANNEKFFKIFGWEPKYNIDSSIKSFLKSVKK